MTTTLKQCPKCGATVPPEAPQGLCPRCVLAEVAIDQPQPSAAHTADAPSLERVAKAFPQLEIVELIGRGGMGFVFKARQPHLDRFEPMLTPNCDTSLKCFPGRQGAAADYSSCPTN